MFIPRYWAEAILREAAGPTGKLIALRRFGWSSVSQADAEVAARRRVEDAAAALREGGAGALKVLERRERKAAYLGSHGVPIREEILRELPDLDVVLTRNVYGAVCLNTTRALFVDVDAAASRAVGSGCWGAFLGTVGATVASALLLPLHSISPMVRALLVLASAIGGLVLFAWAGAAVARGFERRNLRHRDLLAWVLVRVQAWCREHEEWRVAVYRTPAGVRLLPTHAAFDATSELTFAFMAHVGADPLYERMCRLQRCFRARVSPKPWRTRLGTRFRSGGTWPVTDPARLAERARWVERYEEIVGDYASCRFVTVLGEGTADASVEAVRSLHDDLCKAQSRLELA